MNPEQRHAAGLRSIGRDEQAQQEELERYGLVAWWEVDHAEGEHQPRVRLDERDKALAALVAVAALGGRGSLARAAERALREGISPVEVHEVFGHIVTYCGLARARDGYDALREVPELCTPMRFLSAPFSLDDGLRKGRASTVLASIDGVEVGRAASEGRAGLEQALGTIGQSVYASLLGEVWARAALSKRDRSLVVVTILVTQGTFEQLRVHACAGIRHGLSAEDQEAVVATIYPFIGAPRATSGLRAVRSALGECT